MFERFTERARLVVVLAQEESRTLGHHHIGSEHLLLGLLREEQGVAARVLGSLGITVERVRDHLGVQVVAAGEGSTAGQVPFTPRAKKVLELALRESLALGNTYIGTEHLLLGLIHESDGGVGFRTRPVPELEGEEQDGVAHRVLLDFDANSERIRNEIVRTLSQGLPPGGPNRSTIWSERSIGGSRGARSQGRLVVRLELGITPPPAGVEQLHQAAVDSVQRVYEDGGAEVHHAGVHLIDPESSSTSASIPPDDSAHDPPAQN